MKMFFNNAGIKLDVRVECSNPYEEIVISREFQRIIDMVMTSREANVPIEDMENNGLSSYQDLCEEFDIEVPLSNSLKSWHKNAATATPRA